MSRRSVVEHPSPEVGRSLDELRHIELGFGTDVLLADVANSISAERRAVEQAREDVVRRWELRRRGVLRALHDGAQQQLLGLRLDLRRRGPTTTTDLSETTSQRFCERIDHVAIELERLALGLPPSALEIDDIAGVLREIASQCGHPVDVVAPDGLRLSVVVAELLAYTASESLANAVRHSDGARCWMTLVADDDNLTLTIRDDGRGGARQHAGGGIAGLRDRAVMLGGDLQVGSDAGGTSITLTVRDSRPDSSTAEVTTALDSSTGVGFHATDDWQVEIEFARGRDGWCDHHGSSIASNSWSGCIVVTADGVPVARIRSDRTSVDVMATACLSHVGSIIDGIRRARCARALADLVDERDRLARRASAFEAALARRLTTRPIGLLREAQSCLLSSTDSAAIAADLVLEATDALRELVSVLGSGATAISGANAGQDPFLFQLLAHQAGVEIETRVSDVPAGEARDAIFSIGEAVIADAEPGGSLTLRIDSSGRRASMVAVLESLPSPATLSFIEDTARWLCGHIAFEPHGDGVRLRVELPCEL